MGGVGAAAVRGLHRHLQVLQRQRLRGPAGGLCGELVRQPGLCKRALSGQSDLGVAFRPPFKMRGSVFPEEGRGRAGFFSPRPFSRENSTAARPALRPFVCLPRWAGSSWRSEVMSVLIPQPGGGPGAQERPARAE